MTTTHPAPPAPRLDRPCGPVGRVLLDQVLGGRMPPPSDGPGADCCAGLLWVAEHAADRVGT